MIPSRETGDFYSYMLRGIPLMRYAYIRTVNYVFYRSSY